MCSRCMHCMGFALRSAARALPHSRWGPFPSPVSWRPSQPQRTRELRLVLTRPTITFTHRGPWHVRFPLLLFHLRPSVPVCNHTYFLTSRPSGVKLYTRTIQLWPQCVYINFPFNIAHILFIDTTSRFCFMIRRTLRVAFEPF